MLEKNRIVATLGESALLRPALVNGGLIANERAKFLLSLLQSARIRADHPLRQADSLTSERIACGISETAFDDLPARSLRLEDGLYRIEGVAELIERLLAEVEAMTAALDDEIRARLLERLDLLRAGLLPLDEPVLDAAAIDRLTAAGSAESDSVHRVVMDAHRELNRVQALIASEDVAGAACYAITADDRPRIAAFMAGVASTIALKFDHPGLGTTATRCDERLVIQNDIGTTDAHVLVISVEGLRLRLTYTDVHLQRLLFLQRLLAASGMRWEDPHSRSDENFEDGIYHWTVGTIEASGEQALCAALTTIGSKLVFLIDWNRARKRLRPFLPKSAALALLRWAAEEKIGHMAWLRMGGEALIHDALQFAAQSRPGLALRNASLADLLGAERANEYLRHVFRFCADAAARGEPPSFVQDSARAELLTLVRSEQHDLMELAAEHAAWITELAQTVRDALIGWHACISQAQLQALAARAKRQERCADELVNQVREFPSHTELGAFSHRLVHAADDIADELEDAAFNLALLPRPGAAGTVQEPMRRLAELLVQGAQEYVKAIAAMRSLRLSNDRTDTRDLLDAIHKLLRIEQQTDLAQRAVDATLATEVDDFKTFHFLSRAALNLETAADALMHCALSMRDQALGEIA